MEESVYFVCRFLFIVNRNCKFLVFKLISKTMTTCWNENIAYFFVEYYSPLPYFYCNWVVCFRLK